MDTSSKVVVATDTGQMPPPAADTRKNRNRKGMKAISRSMDDVPTVIPEEVKLSKNAKRKSRERVANGHTGSPTQEEEKEAEKEQEKEQEKQQEKEPNTDSIKRKKKKKNKKKPQANELPNGHVARPLAKKNPFIPRHSPLDHSQVDSSLNTSEFRGFFNLFLIAGGVFVFAANGRHLLGEGTLVGLKSLPSLAPFEMIPIWLLMVITSHSIVFIQKLRVLRSCWAPNWVTMTLYVLLQSLIFCGTIYFLLAYKWPIIPTGVYLGEMVIITMKLHSYMMTNKEYESEMKQEELQKKKRRKDAKAPPQSSHHLEPNGAPTSTTPVKESVKFPDNVTLGNFFYFLCAPTLVYELEYPRTEKIRIGYILEKAVTILGVFSVLHIMVNKYISPIILQVSTLSLLEAIILLIMPFLFCYILVFFIMFDLICNGFAEVTRFSDRQFYTDWWNSTTWDEFARKWNKPVHEWLLRHIYLESLKSFRGDKFSANLATFLCSSVAHELVMSVMFRMFRPWMFLLQMLQIPLILCGGFLKGTRAGNFFFWFCMVLGPPLLCILYCREYVFRMTPDEIKEIELALLDNSPTMLI